MWTPMLVCTKNAANPRNTNNQKDLVRMASPRDHESSWASSVCTAPAETSPLGIPSGRRPISSGRSATKNRQGATDTATTITPMVIQVAFRP